MVLQYNLRPEFLWTHNPVRPIHRSCHLQATFWRLHSAGLLIPFMWLQHLLQKSEAHARTLKLAQTHVLFWADSAMSRFGDPITLITLTTSHTSNGHVIVHFLRLSFILLPSPYPQVKPSPRNQRQMKSETDQPQSPGP